MGRRQLRVGLAAFLCWGGLGWAEPLPTTARPRDPWVFRCVLDKRPRMVVLALHQSLWVAYDATDCGMYKAWDGDVKFDGAVYTSVHGPQPTSRGEALQERADDGTWQIKLNGQARDVQPVWEGYRFESGHVTLLYEIAIPSDGDEAGRAGQVMEIEETPEAIVSDNGSVRLERRFVTSGVPRGVSITVAIKGSAPNGHPIELEQDGQALARQAGAGTQHIDLASNGPTRVVATLRRAQAAPAPGPDNPNIKREAGF